MSPRRSSRARTAIPAPLAPSHSASGSSSSSRAERATRSGKAASPQKSGTPASLSSSEVGAAEAALATRRSGRRVEVEEGEAEEEEEDIVEDEETTRCICGLLDYPGPPDGKGRVLGVGEDGQPDEAGGLFIQCDNCKVWQHGGCVGIMEQESAPENYFCEECKPELHHLFKSVSGQRYSRYLPVQEKLHPKPHRKSVTKEPELNKQSAKDKAARLAAEAFTKRRSTMNSRAAYDEDEVLRKVIEESKVEGTAPPESSRKGKRPREESEEARSDVKRQRTGTTSPTSSHSRAVSLAVESDHERKKAPPRGAAARSQREKEMRERERERQEAANKRKGRAERRRAEDSEPVEDPKPNSPEDPPAPADPPSVPPSLSTKKRPLPQKRGRSGRGQNTRENSTHEGSPTRKGKDKSSASPKEGDAGSGADSAATGTTANNRKGGNKADKGGKDPTMGELKRRAAAMLDFIAQSQVEMARAGGKGLTMGGVEVEGSAKLADVLATKLVKWQNEYGKY
ncbi:hypothetical protein EJ06DRAFT_560589 [Trichodelitschia bisporula]|uniref:Zinc finger PHD-type domain-containing protein n=1 Tax=Trichodelitschia bisporula TaxID=703511 RepID=A0A6G1HI61_9PEZI|nr:hypothetical protein EJ06DRAFT_560589 [Trichodelitschia bisporula]